MKKVIYVLLVMFFVYSCNTTKKEESKNEVLNSEESVVIDIHTSRDSLDWTGIYKGIIPSASGEGTDIEILIREDNTFLEKSIYLGKSEEIFEVEGNFEWDNSGQIISLFEKGDIYRKYFVGENKIIMLDTEGNFIEGQLKDLYVLDKLVP